MYSLIFYHFQWNYIVICFTLFLASSTSRLVISSIPFIWYWLSWLYMSSGCWIIISGFKISSKCSFNLYLIFCSSAITFPSFVSICLKLHCFSLLRILRILQNNFWLPRLSSSNFLYNFVQYVSIVSFTFVRCLLYSS